MGLGRKDGFEQAAYDPLSALYCNARHCLAVGKGCLKEGQAGRHWLLQWAMTTPHLTTGRLSCSESAQEYERQPSNSVYSAPGLFLCSVVFALGMVGMRNLTRTGGDGRGGAGMKRGSDS